MDTYDTYAMVECAPHGCNKIPKVRTIGCVTITTVYCCRMQFWDNYTYSGSLDLRVNAENFSCVTITSGLPWVRSGSFSRGGLLWNPADEYWSWTRSGMLILPLGLLCCKRSIAAQPQAWRNLISKQVQQIRRHL